MTGTLPDPDLNPWARAQPGLVSLQLEDDIRDALQSVRSRRPDLETRRELLRLTASMGVAYSFLGFPGASATEAAQCTELVKTVCAEGLAITPVVMARAVTGDVESLARVQDTAGYPVLADIYVPTSAIRARIERWTLEEMLTRLQAACTRAKEIGVGFRVAFEDSSRTSAQAMERALDAAIATGTNCVVLNDTVGTCLPGDAGRHVTHAADHLRGHGIAMALAWHGHNDKGLALANALAAADAGAQIISGTFTGVGERTGNIPLEQLMYLAVDAGNPSFDLAAIPRTCAAYAGALRIDVPTSAPLIGRDAFSTATGTHAAALVKARSIGEALTDRVYSGVEARRLGREEKILIGPGSGRAGIMAVLTSLGTDPQPRDVDGLLAYCRRSATCLEDPGEILHELHHVRQGADREDEA